MWQYLLLTGLTAFSANAQDVIETLADKNDETMIFGEAQNANGTMNEVVVEQPQNAKNPLGNPIPENVRAPAFSPADTVQSRTLPQTNGIEQNSIQNPSDSQMTPQQMNNEIQNRLYQEGNRVYDVQSYPADDLKTINKNGQDAAVTNYPAY